MTLAAGPASLWVGGVDIGTLIADGSLVETPVYSGIPGEPTQGGSLFSSVLHERGDWEFVLPFISADQAVARRYRHHLNGLGETWFWLASTSTTGSKGTTPNAGGTYTPSASGGPTLSTGATGHVEVGSNSFIELPTGIDHDVAEGWTAKLYRYETIADDGAAADAWYRYILNGSSTSITVQTRNGVTGAHGAGNWFTMASDGDVRLLGKDSDATNNAKDYAQVEIVPFLLSTTAFLADLDGWMTAYAWAGLPYHLAGDGYAGEFVDRFRAVRCLVSRSGRQRYGTQQATQSLAVSMRERDPRGL